MSGLGVQAAVRGFFDSPAVVAAMDKAERRVLSRFGAFVRTRARSSIRKRKNPSPPGSPPSSHTGELRRFLFFSYDPASRSVVIGPARLGGKRGDAPATLEYGGTGTVPAGKPLYRPRRPGRDARGRFVTAGFDVIQPGTRLSYPARPTMGPALAAERPKFAELFRDQFRKG